MLNCTLAAATLGKKTERKLHVLLFLKIHLQQLKKGFGYPEMLAHSSCLSWGFCCF